MEAIFLITTSTLPTQGGVFGMCRNLLSNGFTSPPLEILPGASPGEWVLKAQLPDGTPLNGIADQIKGYFGELEGYIPTTVAIVS